MSMSFDQAILSARGFVNSIGVNTHAGYSWGAYNDLALMEDDLKYLGVTKLRDGLANSPVAQPVVDGLAAAGYKFDMGVSSALPAGGSAALSQYIVALNQFEAAHPGSITAIEGLNEANIQPFSFDGSSSIAAAAQFQRVLYAAVHGDSHLAGIPVYDLTVAYNDAAAFSQLGNMANAADYANLHAYIPTNTAPAAGIAADLSAVSATAPGKPTVITETGYTTQTSTPYIGADQTVQAKSILNTLVDAYKAGVSSTYIYELLDENSSGSSTGGSASNFGLFTADGTPKLGATAIHNLTTILADNGSGGHQPTASLGYSLANMPSTGNSMVLGKSNGAYDLVVWAEPQIWNAATNSEISNPTQTVTVHLGTMHHSVKVYDPMHGTAPIAVYSNVQDIQVPVTDHPVIIEIDAPATTVGGGTSVPADVSGTAVEIVAQLSTLNAATGLKTITLTDTHTLPVASEATMSYIISHYSRALAAIQGGYTFSITNSTATWSETKVFNGSGALLSTADSVFRNGVITSKETVHADHSTDTIYYHGGVAAQEVIVQPDGPKETKFYGAGGSLTKLTLQNPDGSSSTTLYSGGVETQKWVTNADGSRDSYAYHITGRAYTADHQHTNAAGKLLSDTRTHADGSLDYTMVINSDGSKVTTLYNSVGQKTTMITLAGSATTTEMYNTSGQLTEEIVRRSTGAVTTTHYAGALVSAVYIVNADGSKETKLYDAAGNLSSDSLLNRDGTSSNTLYADGIKTKMYVTNADGSHDTYSYHITGQSYTSEVQHANPKGEVTELTRMHANGSLDYKMVIEADGTHVTALYDSAGQKITETYANPDGSNVTDIYNTSGSLVQSIAKTAHDDVTTTNYSDGHTASIYVVNADGSKDSKLFDSTGHLTSDSVQNANGSSAIKLYTDGVLMKDYVTNTDGSHDDYSYHITGEPYATDHQHIGTSGQLLAETRTHADGSVDYTMTIESDGAKVTDLFNSTGHKTLETINNPNGSKEIYKYAVAGSPGAIEHDSYDAAGHLLVVDVLNSNGTHDITAVAHGLTVSAGKGNDVISTLGGSTTVVYGGGNDQINNFHAGAGVNHDTIQIAQSLAADYSHLQIEQSGANTLVHIAANDSVLLKNVSASSVTHSDFHFV